MYYYNVHISYTFDCIPVCPLTVTLPSLTVTLLTLPPLTVTLLTLPPLTVTLLTLPPLSSLTPLALPALTLTPLTLLTRCHSYQMNSGNGPTLSQRDVLLLEQEIDAAKTALAEVQALRMDVKEQTSADNTGQCLCLGSLMGDPLSSPQMIALHVTYMSW